jgi:tetratricopeptide (TPR) repeat protein
MQWSVAAKMFVLGLCFFISSWAPAQAPNDSLLRDAAQSLAAGNLQRAEVELQTVLKQSPNDYRALDFLGLLRAEQQRNADAEELFQRAIGIKPDSASAHIHLGLLYIQMGRADDAIPPLQDGLRIAPERTDAAKALLNIWQEQARTAVARGESEKALAALISARKLAPDDPDVNYQYGMVALRMSLLADAISAFQSTLKSRNDDALALYGLGRAYMDSSKFEDARQQFAKYLELRPNDASGHYALGMSLAALERSQDAATEFQRSITLSPVQTESYFRLGLLQLDAKDLDSAVSNFRRVLDRDPKHAGALAGLGRVQLEQKKYPEAADLLQRAIAGNDQLREAHYFLGLTYARMGRKEESEQQLQIATRLEHEEAEKQRTVFKILDTGSEDTSANQK